MDDLKLIWHQLNSVSDKVEAIIQSREKDDSVYVKLLKEEGLRKKFNPYLILLIILFVFLFTWIVYLNKGGLDFSEKIGIMAITAASVTIAVFAQIVKIPLKRFEYSQSSTDFFKVVKLKLDQSKRMLVTGVILQVSFLTIGLYFLIFHNSQLQADPSYLYSFIGSMLGMGGLAVGCSIAFFNFHYKDIYKKIDAFLT